jgi:hypothetical protein
MMTAYLCRIQHYQSASVLNYTFWPHFIALFHSAWQHSKGQYGVVGSFLLFPLSLYAAGIDLDLFPDD